MCYAEKKPPASPSSSDDKGVHFTSSTGILLRFGGFRGVGGGEETGVLILLLNIAHRSSDSMFLIVSSLLLASSLSLSSHAGFPTRALGTFNCLVLSRRTWKPCGLDAVFLCLIASPARSMIFDPLTGFPSMLTLCLSSHVIPGSFPHYLSNISALDLYVLGRLCSAE